jgi:hypothetical protein
MSQQVICDECGMPIDQTLPYYAATVTPMQTLDGQIVAGESVKRDRPTCRPRPIRGWPRSSASRAATS